MYLVLITNRGSNIIEDLDTLRLVSKVVAEQHAASGGAAGGLTEESVTGRAFEIIFALDEVITAGGYREDVTLSQIRVNLEMESHEEKLHQMIKASKMAQAKVRGRRAALRPPASALSPAARPGKSHPPPPHPFPSRVRARRRTTSSRPRSSASARASKSAWRS